MNEDGRKWFGDLPAGWLEAPIGYHFDVVLGKMINARNEVSGGVSAPYLAAGSIQPDHLLLDDSKRMDFSMAELRKYALKRGDIVVVEGGAGYGRSHLLKDDLVGWGFQNHVARVRQRSGSVLPGFLVYVLKACLASGYIEANNRTATLPSLSRDVLSAIISPMPPLDEQCAIADYLDHETAQIDALVAKQEELLGFLAERKRSVLDHVLAGVGGELRRLRWLYRPSGEANKPDEEVLSVYREHGVIPKSSRTDNFNKTPENVDRYLLVRPDDLVVNKMKAWQGSLGISAHRGIVSGDYEVLRPITGDLDPEYAHFRLRSPEMVLEYRLRSRGIRPSQWRLYWQDLADIEVIVPALAEQQVAAARIKSETAQIDTLIAKTEQHIALAKERRSALITAAVTGQINVRTARKAS